jgi:hypothetical protein
VKNNLWFFYLKYVFQRLEVANVGGIESYYTFLVKVRESFFGVMTSGFVYGNDFGGA